MIQERLAPPEGDVELREWIDSLDYLIQEEGPERVREVLDRLRIRAEEAGIPSVAPLAGPYINTIPAEDEPPYPGDRELEEEIEHAVRWNSVVMVSKANRKAHGIGGHLSTYASAAVLYEVGFNHFFRGAGEDRTGDQVFIQGHASPGIYARAFLEGRLTERQLVNFRREFGEGGGLPSYPHPWLMPRFWQFPTVSMGLGPLMAAYQARFNRYLELRGLKDTSSSRVWAFLGDGETDEAEALAGVRMAARDGLDNLIYVVNCNLQRLDGPVRGNGRIVQELEGVFRGAGWNVIKVLWSGAWDPIFDRDRDGALAQRLGEISDGDYIKMVVEGGSYIRQHLFNTPALRALVANLSDQDLDRLAPGGTDPVKVFAAYRRAVETKGVPTAVLIQNIKGWGLGANVAGRNLTHQAKDLPTDELRNLRDRLGLPLTDEQVEEAAFYRLSPDSRAAQYLKTQRERLGGFLPERRPDYPSLPAVPEGPFEEFKKGSERSVSTTSVLVHLLTNLLRDEKWGRYLVPIVPDEARTFGMESLFKQVGIFSAVGQRYEPVDAQTLLPYRESRDGQIFEEGITEAGGISSFIAAATAGPTHGLPMVPFYWFYSMFGLQRSGDLIWAAGELRSKGFLVGGLSGRTQLHGEGLQHQDGQSHLLALPVPNLMAYDPAYAYEVAAIIKDGLRRMFVEQEDVFYYVTVGNEAYPQPPEPEGVEEGILRGLYLLHPSEAKKGAPVVRLLGSGAILNEAVRARDILQDTYGIGAEVWSVTSYKALLRDAEDAERSALLRPGEARLPYITQALGPKRLTVAATDYVRALPDTVARWVPGRYLTLGTDGFGRSATREELRDFFEVDAAHIAYAALSGLAEDGSFERSRLDGVRKDLGIRVDLPNPVSR